MKKTDREAGFTLMEVMIVVAVVGILSAIAYPSYTQYVLRSHRAQARAMLLEAAQWMERNYTLTQSYAVRADNGNAMGNAALNAAGLRTVPRDGGDTRYLIAFSGAVGAQAYTLIATPQGAQTGDTRCGSLTLTNLQVQGHTGTAPIDECWGR